MSFALRLAVPAFAVGAVALIAACHGKAEFPSEHREAALACPSDPRFASSPMTDAGVATPADDSCSSDDACTKGNHGRCVSHGHTASHCSYDACMSDGDCAAGTTCDCARDGNRCVASNCRSDAECGGLGCSPAQARSCNDPGGVVGYFCHTKADSCTDSDDCGGRTNFCEYSPPAGHWVCVDHGRCVG